MTKNNSINFMMYKIFENGRFEEFSIPFGPTEFDYGKAFYLIIDKAYINNQIEEDDLARRIDHIAVDGPIQVIYCPPTKEDIEAIYTMAEDIRIAGVYSSCILEEGSYKGKKCTYHFFTSNKATHCFTQEELVDRICSGVEERTFKQKVKDTPEIKIDKKGRVIH